MDNVLEVGSFIIFSKPCLTGSVFVVKYAPQHTHIIEWHFINEQNLAIEFAKRQTKIDRKIFA